MTEVLKSQLPLARTLQHNIDLMLANTHFFVLEGVNFAISLVQLLNRF